MAETDKDRRPMPGDAVRYTGEFVRRVLLCGEANEHYYLPLDSRGRLGTLEGVIGQSRGEYLLVFNLYGGRAFRGGNNGATHKGVVSASGGPGYYIGASALEPTDETVTMRFWCWKGLPCANGGMDYEMKVPVWNWDPDKEAPDAR